MWSRLGQPTDDKITAEAAEAIKKIRRRHQMCRHHPGRPWLTTNQFLDTLDTNLQRAMPR